MTGEAERGRTASPRRRRQARQQGHVPQSRDFVFAIVYAVCGAAMLVGGPGVMRHLRERLQHDLHDAAVPLQDPLAHAQQYIVQVGWWLLPWVLMISIAVVVAHWAQHGPLWIPSRIAPELNRVNPAHGIQRIVRRQGLVGGLLNFVRVGLIMGVAVWLFSEQWRHILALAMTPPEQLGPRISILLFRFGAWLGISLLIWGGIDFALQLYRYEHDLRMTPDEMRDEIKAVHNDVSDSSRQRAKTS